MDHNKPKRRKVGDYKWAYAGVAHRETSARTSHALKSHCLPTIDLAIQYRSIRASCFRRHLIIGRLSLGTEGREIQRRKRCKDCSAAEPPAPFTWPSGPAFYARQICANKKRERGVCHYWMEKIEKIIDEIKEEKMNLQCTHLLDQHPLITNLGSCKIVTTSLFICRKMCLHWTKWCYKVIVIFDKNVNSIQKIFSTIKNIYYNNNTIFVW